MAEVDPIKLNGNNIRVAETIYSLTELLFLYFTVRIRCCCVINLFVNSYLSFTALQIIKQPEN